MNYIKFTLLALFATVAIMACNQKNANQTQDVTDGTVKKPPVAEKPDPAPAVDEKAFQVMGFQKTPCFGKCPVYEVKFFNNGAATWNGRMNTERMGLYEARVDEKTLKDIRDRADAIGYWDFYAKYPVENQVADLPSTITMIRVGDMIKTVRNTHDGPEELEAFQKYLSEIIEGLEWIGGAKE